MVIDAVTPQKKLRTPIELHLWRKEKPFKKIEIDSTGYFLLPEMNIKIAVQQPSLIFVDAVTGNVLQDSGQLGSALEETKQRATAAEQRAKTAFEDGEQKGQLTEKQGIARNLLSEGFDQAMVAKTTGLSLNELSALSPIQN